MNITGLILFGLLVYCAIGPKLHAASDHFGWKYNAAPDWNAIITNVHTITEKVGKMTNGIRHM